MSFAKSSQELAILAMQKTRSAGGTTFFSGHWGFQYYMQELGARPFDFASQEMTSNDLLVDPENNANSFRIEPDQVASSELIETDRNWWITPMHHELGAAFYSSVFGPLPYAWGRVPPERVAILRFKPQR
jgi:hypothetical protein